MTTTITDFDSLKAAIADWLVRDSLEDQVSDFIAFAETRFNYGNSGPFPSEPLRVRQMEEETNLSPTDGVYTLPDDFLEPRRITALTSPRRPLTMQASGQLDWRFPHREAGCPSFYSIEGNSLVVLPKTSADVELLYYQLIPALGAAAPTNWLLERHPDLYLYGALLESGLYTSSTRAQAWAARMAAALDGVTMSDRAGRWAGGPVYARTATP